AVHETVGQMIGEVADAGEPELLQRPAELGAHAFERSRFGEQRVEAFGPHAQALPAPPAQGNHRRLRALPSHTDGRDDRSEFTWRKRNLPTRSRCSRTTTARSRICSPDSRRHAARTASGSLPGKSATSSRSTRRSRK